VGDEADFVEDVDFDVVVDLIFVLFEIFSKNVRHLCCIGGTRFFFVFFFSNSSLLLIFINSGVREFGAVALLDYNFSCFFCKFFSVNNCCFFFHRISYLFFLLDYVLQLWPCIGLGCNNSNKSVI